MNCRGERKRAYIVNNYYIEPIAHLKLLNGRTIHSDAGGDITDSYFIFRCVDKRNKDIIKLIQCGRPTAQDFCQKIGKNLPPIFNPLAENYQIQENREFFYHNDNGIINAKWNPVRKQLYNAVMLIISAWQATPNTPLFNIKIKLEENIEEEPKLSLVKSVNTILCHANTTLSDIIESLSRNNNLRDFSFNLLIRILTENKIEQYFSK